VKRRSDRLADNNVDDPVLTLIHVNVFFWKSNAMSFLFSDQPNLALDLHRVLCFLSLARLAFACSVYITPLH